MLGTLELNYDQAVVWVSNFFRHKHGRKHTAVFAHFTSSTSTIIKWNLTDAFDTRDSLIHQSALRCFNVSIVQSLSHWFLVIFQNTTPQHRAISVVAERQPEIARHTYIRNSNERINQTLTNAGCQEKTIFYQSISWTYWWCVHYILHILLQGGQWHWWLPHHRNF